MQEAPTERPEFPGEDLIDKDILRANGETFKSQAAALAGITKLNCVETHSVYLTEQGGWMGVPNEDPRLEEMKKRLDEAPKPKAPEPPTDPKRKKYPVRVMRISGDEANRDLIIKVTANGPNERAVFRPGEKVELTITQLNILNDAVQDTVIEIEPTSGIYSSRAPEVAAQNMYPGMEIIKDPYTGYLRAVRKVRHYSINFLGERPPGWVD